MNNELYLDAAATTQIDPEALSAMTNCMRLYPGNPSQSYTLGKRARDAMEDARKRIANALKVKPNEIYFTSGGTEANNLALNVLAYKSYQRLFVSAIEHHSVLLPAQRLQDHGKKVGFLQPNERGVVDTSELDQAFAREDFFNRRNFYDTLVSVMTINNETGVRQPIEELANTTKERGAFFHTDAVQAVGHIEFYPGELGVDMASASAHKFNGPRGVGFLYVREGVEFQIELKLTPIMLGGGQERGLRPGTENVPGVVGMAVALENNLKRLKDEKERLLAVRRYMLERLIALSPLVKLNAPPQEPLSSIFSIALALPNGSIGESVMHLLDLKGISVGIGSACNSQSTEISHVLAAMNIPEEDAKHTIRVSLTNETTCNVVDFFIDALQRILHKLNDIA